MVLSTSPAALYSRSQVTGGEDPFGLPRLDPCLQPHLRPTTHSVDWGDPNKTQPCKSGKKPKSRTLAPKNIITKTSRLFYFKKKHKGSNTLIFLVPVIFFIALCLSRANHRLDRRTKIWRKPKGTKSLWKGRKIKAKQRVKGGEKVRVKQDAEKRGGNGGEKVRVKGEMQRRGEGGWRLNVSLGLEIRKDCIYTCFFLSGGWLNRFGSVRFNRFQALETETEPNRNFLWFFNRLIRFFFSVIFFPVFSV